MQAIANNIERIPLTLGKIHDHEAVLGLKMGVKIHGHEVVLGLKMGVESCRFLGKN